MAKKFDNEYTVGNHEPMFVFSAKSFKRNLTGKIMWDIHFFRGLGCKNRIAYKKALKGFAESIIKQVREVK